MKILFICRSNAGRSQTAEAFFKSDTKEHKASSAGLDVRSTKNVGMPPDKRVTAVMKRYYGIDISKWKRKQVTQSMLRSFDKVVVLMPLEERRKYLPDYFRKFYKKIVFWDIVDLRDTKSANARKERAEKIRLLVKQLIDEPE